MVIIHCVQKAKQTWKPVSRVPCGFPTEHLYCLGMSHQKKRVCLLVERIDSVISPILLTTVLIKDALHSTLTVHVVERELSSNCVRSNFVFIFE